MKLCAGPLPARIADTRRAPKPPWRFTATALVLLSILVPNLFAASGNSVRILKADQRDRAFLLQPGATATFTILAQAADGSGVPGVTLNFAAPTEGPSGTFPASNTPTRTYLSVQTDANGIAAATFVTNDIPGLFEVGASVAGGTAITSFAVTNTPEPPETPLEPQAVRDAVNQQLYDGVASTELFQLHGPFFVPQGAVIRGYSEGRLLRHGPVPVARDSWLLWADQVPNAQFAHEAEWILVDAGDASGFESAVTYHVRWWPIVEDPETGDEDSLYTLAWAHPEAEQLDSDGSPIETGEAIAAARSLSMVRHRADAKTACAILMYGPDTPPADVLKYERYLLLNGLVPRENIFKNVDANGNPKPVSTSDIDKLIDAAKARKCDKVYLMFATHGGEDAEGGGLATRGQLIGYKNKFGNPNFPVHQHVKLKYEQFVVKLERLGNIELNIFQNSCFSGQLLDWIQGRGFTGMIVSSTSEGKVGWVMPWGSVVLDYFLRAKTTSKQAADTDHDGTVTDWEAIDWVRTQKFVRQTPLGPIDWIAEALPQVDAIQPVWPRRMSVPNVYIPLGQPREVLLRRPFNAKGDMTGGLTVFDTSIAEPVWSSADKLADRRQGVKKFTLDSSKIKIWFRGKDCGSTVYEVRLFIGEQEYHGQANIQVGRFKATPMKIRMQTNSSRYITLDFYGKSFNGPEPLHSNQVIKSHEAGVTIDTDKADVAKPSPGALIKAGDQTTAKFQALSGQITGKAKFTITEDKNYSSKFVEIEVYKPGDKRVGLLDACPTTRKTYAYAAKVRNINDKWNHGPRVGAWESVLGSLWLENGSMGIDGNIPQWVAAVGDVDCMTGRFTLKGNSGNTQIAGYSNVPAVYTGALPDDGSMSAGVLGKRAIDLPGLDIVYELGEGAFPNGPIVYELDGTVDVGDAACEYSLEPAGMTRSFPEGTATVSITTDAGCGWMASSDQPWLTVDSEMSPMGASVLELTYEENPGETARTATVTVAGQPFTFTQEGQAATRPVIAAAGIVNGTSFDRGVAPGTWLTIQGWNLSATTRIWNQSDFNGSSLPTSLDGVRVTIGGIPAYVYFISPTQLNVLAADGLEQGYGNVIVTNAAGTSDPRLASIRTMDPGLFQFDPEQRAYVAAVHPDGAFVGKPDLFGGAVATRPALPLEDILLYGSGFGPTDPPTPSGQLVPVATPLARPVVVLIGGRVAQVKYAGLISSGLVQLNIVIPDGLPAGDYEVEIFVDGVPIQDGVFITIGE